MASAASVDANRENALVQSSFGGPARADGMPAKQRASGVSRYWRVFVPVVCLVAGVVFATSARESRGTELRAPGTANLVDTVRAAEARVHNLDGRLHDHAGSRRAGG